MAYTKQSFTDQVLDASGNVVQRGTVLKKEHLDHMEDGIYQAHEQLGKKLSAPASPKVGDYLRIKSIAADGTMVVEGVQAPEAVLPERPTFLDLSLVTEQASAEKPGVTLVPEGTGEKPALGLYGYHDDEPVELCNVAEATEDQSAPNLAQVRGMISAAMNGATVPAGTVTLTANGDYDVAQYANAEVAIPEVAQAVPEITVNEDGRIGYTITQEEGYVVGGTRFGSQTQPTTSAATIRPGTVEKVAVPKGSFTTGDVKVAGDVNLVSENIKEGITLFGVEGTLAEEIEAESLNAVHQWEKYTVESITETEVTEVTMSLYMTTSTTNPWDPVDYADEIEMVDGALQLVNPTTITLNNTTKDQLIGKYVLTSVDKVFYKIPSDATMRYSSGMASTIVASKAYQLTAVAGGELVGVVLSEDIEAYPQEGEQDGYRYVYIGTLENTGGEGGLGITGATVGQIAQIAAVDENGVPTAWQAVDMPTGSDSGENLVQGIGITTIMAITQAKYDELVILGTVDESTLYIIKPESNDGPDLTMIPVLRSDGTAYIDLGIAAPADAWYEVCFRGIADMDQYDAIFGNTHTMVGTAGGGLTGTWMTGYYAGSSYATFGTASIDISTKHVFKVTSSALILDGDTENAKAITAGTVTYKNPLYLFATNKYTSDSNRTDKVSGVSAIDLFYLRIWSSEDKILHNYVPAQDSESVACIYDTVDKAYLYNAAEAGAFEYREELEES